MIALTIKTLSFHYTECHLFDDLSFTIPQGSLTAIIGPNGAGKSTLLKLICGFLTPIAGSISVADHLKVCYLPQRSEFDPTFPLLVEDVVSMGLWDKLGNFSALSSNLKQTVNEAIDTVGLKGYEKASLHHLSGGQLQRLLFARMSLQDGDTLLLDEPFAAIDHTTIKDLMMIIQKWQKQGKTVLVVVHNIDLVRTYFPSSLLLARQVMAFGETDKVLTRDTMTKAMYNV